MDGEKVAKLLDILLRQDDGLLPSFCNTLTAVRQPDVVHILRRNGRLRNRNRPFCIMCTIVFAGAVLDVSLSLGSFSFTECFVSESSPYVSFVYIHRQTSR